MIGNIKISNSAKTTVIDIQGVIGVPEQWQFEDPKERVATYEKFQALIAAIENISAQKIVVNIRSTGGDVNDALLILDALNALDAKITTRCFGYVASAATIIAQAASAGKREISSNALYLIHNSVSSTEGNAKTISQLVELLDKTDSRIADIYAHRSGKSAEHFAELMSQNSGNGRWLDPHEALKAGLIDKIIGSEKVENSAEKMVEKMGLTPLPELTQKSTGLRAMLEKIGAALGLDSTPQGDQLSFELPTNYQGVIDSLQKKVGDLQAQNAKLAAMPSKTRPKDDPAPTEYTRTANQEAYSQDLKSFR